MIYGHRRRYLYLGDPGYLTASPQAIDAALDRIDRAKITDVLLIVWNGQGAVWYQPTASVADTSSNQTWDALAYWISRAHRRGIRCHAWFAVAYRVATFNVYPAFSPAGTPASKYNLWLQPVRDWLAANVSELMRRYEWDGIHLDYMRTGGLWEGTDAEARYLADTGRNLVTDKAVWLTTPGNSGGGIQMSNWLKAAVETTMDSLIAAAQAQHPGIERSTYGLGYACEYDQGRRIREWLDTGKMDVAFAEQYGDVPIQTQIDKAYNGWTDGVTTAAPIAAGKRMAIAFSIQGGDGSSAYTPYAGSVVANNLKHHRDLYPCADQALYVYQGGPSVYLTDDQIDWMVKV